MKRAAIVLALLLGACGRAAPPPPTAAVERSALAVCRPTFTVDDRALSAGTGFLLQTARGPVLVTAHHLFGPDGGLARQIEAADLPKRASGVDCAALRGDGVWSGGRPVPVPGAHPIGAPVKFRDVALFPLDQASAGAASGRALRLASTDPRKGETVWLVAPLVRGAPPGQLLHPARVDVVTNGVLAVVFENGELDMRATSGAPFVNAAGEVVGSNVAGGRLPASGRVTAYANSLDALRQAVAEARLGG